MKKGEAVAISIYRKIMVDAVLFRKVNPNYVMPSIIEAANNGFSDSETIDLSNVFEDLLGTQPDYSTE